MRFKSTILLTTVLMIHFGAMTAKAIDWPKWRGPSGNSISKETQWNPKAVNDTFTKVWEVQVGSGWSAVAVDRGKVFTMGNTTGKDIVWCLDEATGKTIWKHEYACPPGNFPGPRATPVVEGDRVYTVGRNGDIYALKTQDGSVAWHVNVIEAHGAVNITWGISSSAVIDGNTLLINANTHGIALNKNTGAKIWASAPGKCGYASATVYTQKGKKYAAIFGEKAVYGVDLATGKALWSHPWVTDYDVNAADPVYLDGKLFISSGYGRGCALLDLSGPAPKVVYENKNMSSHFGSFVVKGRYLYGPDGDTGDAQAKISCLNIDTGELAWSQVVGNNALMAAGDYLITISERGRVHIAQWSPDSYQEVATAVVLPTSRRNPSWTAPVLANGVLYCRNGRGQLVAINMK